MSKGYFGKGKTKKWSWEDFKTTENFPIPKNLMDWIVGQDRAMQECKLCLDEWIQKLKNLKKDKWWKFWEKAESDKPSAKEWLPAGPFLLLLGKQGTGKSLLGRALATHLSDLYEKYGIKLYDVMCWKNKTIPSEPRISIAPSPEGRKEVIKLKKKEGRRGFIKRVLLKLGSGILAVLGSFTLFVGFYWWFAPWIFNWMTQWGYPVQVMYSNFFDYSVSKIGVVLPFLMGGSSMLMGSVFILFFGRFMGGMMSGKQGIGGAESTNAPKLLIDNSDGRAKFVDATGHTSAQLYGSIAWDPYQRYSKDTLILTSKGWKLIKDVRKDESVITLNRQTGKVEIQPIEWWIMTDVDGKVVNFKNRHFDLIVDQDHAIYNAENKERERAGDYIDREVAFTRLADWEGKTISMSDTFLRFIAWYVTEGSSFIDGYHRRIKICQVDDQTKVQRIMEIIRDLGMKYSYDGKDIRIHHAPREIFDYVQALGTSALNKRIPEEIKNASERQLRLFFDEMIRGDGWKHSSNHIQYFTSSFRLCADVQEIGLKLGWATTVWTDDRRRGWTKNTAYSITFVKGGTFSVKGQLIPYKGKMYCVGVPNGVIFVMRNGKPVWCGNTGGLGTPEHQRVTVGDVHRAFMGILYIDEIKNLHGEEAVTLLTVLEDGQLAITLRDRWHGGGTSAMAVSTEPVPCMTFFVAAGNMDSVPQIHPALMDRIYGYGKVVHMNEDMDNTIENRRKYVQFIAQEIKRFGLLPFSREACIEVIEEARRKSQRKDKLTCIFRPMISVIKTASILALNAGERVVGKKYVREAIEEHCKTVQRQFMEKQVEIQRIYKLINPESEPKIGQIHGGAVMQDFGSGDQVGTILPIRASVIEVKEGYFNVTGVKTEDNSWIQNSIKKVSHVAKQIYGLKEKGVGVHIDFAQSVDIDGPSAGIAMLLLLASCLKKKKLRQDTIVTGEINISVSGEMVVTPVGGIHAKIMAAQDWGFKRILIPKRNYEYNIKPEEYAIEIIPCETLKDYEKGMFDEEN